MQIDELRFLVVDDHPFQRWAMGNILTSLGARHVCLVHDGNAAIDAFRRADASFDIVVTDLDMPGMDGMELIRQLAREGTAASLIVTSALGRSVLASVKAMGDAYGLRVVAALEKPASMRGLRAAIEQHTARAAPASPAASVTAIEIAGALREGELEPRFEPRVAMGSRRVVSAQAAPVWAEPSGRVTTADAFLDVARRAGLAPQMGWSLMRKALIACADWRRDGLELGLCVPIAIESLRDPGYAQRAKGCACDGGIEPADVLLQFDAAPHGDGLGAMLENLSRLRMFGFGVSLPYGPRLRRREDLEQVPCSELAIDVALARGEWMDGATVPALASAAAAHGLGMSIGVHGIASRADWNLAATLGADVAAGACLGAPLSGAAFAQETARRPVWQGLR